METIQQSPFLTTLSHFPESRDDKQSMESIKQNIKQVLSRMPQKQIIDKIVKNMGIGVQVLNSLEKVLKDKYAGVKKLKMILKHLQSIHLQYCKFANPNQSSNPNAISKQNVEFDKKNVFNGELESPKKGEQNSFLLSNQFRVVKAQIERQIFERKCVNQIRYRSRSQKKNQLIQQKMNNAKQMNNRCEKVYKSEKQKEKLKNEEIIKHRRLLSGENQGWRIKQTKNILTPQGSPKTQPTQRFYAHKRFTPVYHFKAINPIENQLEAKQLCPNESAQIKTMFNNTARTGSSESRFQRYQSVLKRKLQTEMQHEQSIIDKAIKKNMRIALVTRQKCLKTQTAQSSKGEKQNREPLKKSNTLIFSRSQSGFEWFQQEEKLRQKQNQKIQRKECLKQMKSDLVRQRALRSRDRFLRNKFQIDAVTKIKVDKAINGEKQFRSKLQLKRQSESKRIEEIIRKKRQQCEFKQTLSDEISNLKKYSDRQLQKYKYFYARKLEEMNRNCMEHAQNEAQQTVVGF